MDANLPDGNEATTNGREKQRDWQDFRCAIVHEDNLVNHRLTWLLTIEGFLIGGFFVAQSMVVSKQLTGREIWGLEMLLLFVFTMASWVCVVSSTMIQAAHAQISSIKRIWVTKYPGESRPVLARLPLFAFSATTHARLGTEASPSSPEPVTVSPQPEFPPLIGEYDIRWWQGSPSIPFIFFVINSIMISACLIIGGAEYGKNRSLNRQVRIELTKYGSGAMVKAEYLRDMSPAELDREIKSLLQP